EQKQQEANQEIYNLMLSQQGKFEEGKQLEKKRISEELHDGVLGEMLGIRLFLSGLNDKVDEDAVEQRASLIEKLREVEEDIRGISHELSDASYQKFYNFIVSLEDLIHTISESSGMKCSLTYDEAVDWDDLEGDIKINAYRIVQESLKNCVKHAKAESAEVKFMLRDELLQLTIADDGVGFDSNKGKKGIGFRNLNSRVQKMGGTLQINSKKGKGTTVLVTLEPKYIVRQNPKEAPERKVMVNV
ncbi:MAG: sensor histidine kinase, partial [Bacteroidota bacterium]